jgi:hypothetical protein
MHARFQSHAGRGEAGMRFPKNDRAQRKSALHKLLKQYFRNKVASEEKSIKFTVNIDRINECKLNALLKSCAKAYLAY